MKLDVYGRNISYFTGAEAYLRYRSIPYQSLPTVGNEKSCWPALVLCKCRSCKLMMVADDRHHADAGLADGYCENGTIYPADPMLCFAALLIEDYADEWLWRLAMHYRWSYRLGRVSAAEAIYTDIVEGNRAIPRWLAIRLIKARQLGGRRATESPAKLGRIRSKPTSPRLTDCRISSSDVLCVGRDGHCRLRPDGADAAAFFARPVPAGARARAPAVFEWVARMWNAKTANAAPQFIDKADDAFAALLAEARTPISCSTPLTRKPIRRGGAL